MRRREFITLFGGSRRHVGTKNLLLYIASSVQSLPSSPLVGHQRRLTTGTHTSAVMVEIARQLITSLGL